MRNSDPESIEPVMQTLDTVRLLDRNRATKPPYDPGRAWVALTGVPLSLLCGVVLTVGGIVIFVIQPNHMLSTPLWTQEDHSFRDEHPLSC